MYNHANASSIRPISLGDICKIGAESNSLLCVHFRVKYLTENYLKAVFIIG